MNTAGAVEADPLAALEAWRAQGLAQGDQVGLRVLEGLARRAAAQQGEARNCVMRRADAWMAARAAVMQSRVDTVPTTVQHGGLAALSALVDQLGRARSPAAPSTSPVATPVPLKAVAAFQGTWSRLRAEQRLRQALAQVPAMAGPLHSAQVVHRMLQAVHALSPDYLGALMAHVDTLLWLEQASGGDLPARPASTAEARRRPAARPPRKA